MVRIRRSWLDYSFSGGAYRKGDGLEPEMTALSLRGRFLHPTKKLFGERVQIELISTKNAMVEGDENVGLLQRGADRWFVRAWIPAPSIYDLARACADERFQLAVARGEPLFYNRAQMREIGLHDRKSFEETWGEAFPDPPKRQRSERDLETQ